MFTTILILFVVLGILILVHEWGHFVTARKSGVHVEEFGIGFPPRMVSRLGKDGVIYSINWIPLGGFVKIKGENGEDREDPDSFGSKSFSKRALILSAGVLMNVLLAFFIFSVGYMFGMPQAISDDMDNNQKVTDVKIQIESVLKDSPADLAGLAMGDQIVKIDEVELNKISELQEYIKLNENDSQTLLINRNEESFTTEISSEIIDGFSEDKVIGVALVKTGFVRYNFFESWYQGGKVTVKMLGRIAVAFYDLFKNLILGHGLSADVSGPVGVAVITGQVAERGLIYLLQFTAILSLNLAVLNFIPFPALDGGRFLFIVIEKIRRKPNNQEIENAVHGIGFALLMILIVFITYRDFIKFGGGIIEWFKNIF
ncbi:RIP metalloprotease RseP [bacterium]|jgi:regulator of sigma E protease|nr:RIP metalloprotease RseP [bacterium]MBT4121603.1 RIP metalloprotease RseP [bacterium]MBT4334991.1 RIP metalloprotease RseP [bacterium]MBT4496050.1 RIP metalloprotease RseP [bacterium]MBT4764021.1 RIP metalloprotease RseP [bacterium]